MLCCHKQLRTGSNHVTVAYKKIFLRDAHRVGPRRVSSKEYTITTHETDGRPKYEKLFPGFAGSLSAHISRQHRSTL